MYGTTHGAGSFLLVALVGAGLLACSTPQSLHFAEGKVIDDLRPIEPVPFQLAWARPGVSFRDYSQVLPKFGGITYRRPPRRVHTLAQRLYNHPLPEDMNDRLMEDIAEIFSEELDASANRARGTQPGPFVLLAHVSVVDLVLHVPVDNSGDTLEWVDSVGAFTVVIDLYDSQSRRLVARIAERRAIKPATRQAMRANTGDTVFNSRRIFRDWAQKFNALLDELQGTALAG